MCLQKVPVWHLMVSSASRLGWPFSLTYPRSAGCIIGLSAELTHTHESSHSRWKVNQLRFGGGRPVIAWPLVQPYYPALNSDELALLPFCPPPIIGGFSPGEGALQSAWFLYLVHHLPPIQVGDHSSGRRSGNQPEAFIEIIHTNTLIEIQDA